MPVTTSKDNKGCFAQWGSQKKYYYKCGDKKERIKAKLKASAQARAIYKSGYR